MKYEIELIDFGRGNWLESEIGILTGLSYEEIVFVTKSIKIVRGRDYVRMLQQLGYSTNKRFCKFDRDTPYPCLMRTRKLGDKKHWWGFVYYDNMIYIPGNVLPMTWAQWNNHYPNYKVTSMLQVWI